MRAAWAKSRPVLRLVAVKDPGGIARPGPDGVQCSLSRGPPIDANNQFLRSVSPLVDSGEQFVANDHRRRDWVVDFEGFKRCLHSKRDAAVGPYGIPYSAWKKGGSVVADALYALYVHLLHGGQLHPAFNRSRSVFLPRGDLING
eukprot:1708492-Pyramimonas_sp.AAC.1